MNEGNDNFEVSLCLYRYDYYPAITMYLKCFLHVTPTRIPRNLSLVVNKISVFATKFMLVFAMVIDHSKFYLELKTV